MYIVIRDSTFIRVIRVNIFNEPLPQKQQAGIFDQIKHKASSACQSISRSLDLSGFGPPVITCLHDSDLANLQHEQSLIKVGKYICLFPVPP